MVLLGECFARVGLAVRRVLALQGSLVASDHSEGVRRGFGSASSCCVSVFVSLSLCTRRLANKQQQQGGTCPREPGGGSTNRKFRHQEMWKTGRQNPVQSSPGPMAGNFLINNLAGGFNYFGAEGAWSLRVSRSAVRKVFV